MEQTAEDFVKFITLHENDDTAALLLSKNKWKDIDISLAANTIETRRRLKSKVPSWYAVPELIYPYKLSGEQCSSEETAMLKASVAEKLLKGSHPAITPESSVKDDLKGFRIADLTGGMGIDSFAFSKIAEKVLYNEMNPVIAEATRRNFNILGASNITVSGKMIVPGDTARNQNSCSGNIEEAVSPAELLEEFSPDLIFLDPARRDTEGKKVFLIEDCSPDIMALKDELLAIARFIMIKLSPMADIDMVLDRLGPRCREIYITSSGGECKELLIIMDRDWNGECMIHAGAMSFLRSEEKSAYAVLPDSNEYITEARMLFEPDKALMKSGAFNLICSRLNLVKLAKSTHLYISGSLDAADKCRQYGKVFKILESVHLDKSSVRDAGKRYPKAEVTARNLPMTSDMLRKKLNVSSGGTIHIFGAGAEYGGRRKESFLFITEKQI